MKETIIIKWGGGLITEKSGLNQLRPEVLNRLAQELAQALRENPNLQVILGHGAGSFGHPQALEWLKTKDSKQKQIVLSSVYTLRDYVLQALQSQGLHVQTLSASQFPVQEDWIKAVQAAHEQGKIPLFHGDIVDWDQERIVSTEDLIALLPIPAAKVLFLMDEEGVLKDGKLLPTLQEKDISDWQFDSKHEDVTGGMAHKLEMAFRLVKASPVSLLSGLVPGRFYEAILNRNQVQTQILKD